MVLTTLAFSAVLCCCCVAIGTWSPTWMRAVPLSNTITDGEDRTLISESSASALNTARTWPAPLMIEKLKPGKIPPSPLPEPPSMVPSRLA